MTTYGRAVLVLLLTLLILAPGTALAGDTGFGGLTVDRRLYDVTGASLSAGQTGDLQRRLADLRRTGPDPVVVVRALDATPEETLEQVEQLQRAWVRTSGADPDTAVALLINRNPDDPEDARAGVFVGRSYDEGNVPESEQQAIVTDALIPPLRDGDVHASLLAGLDRLDSSIRNGPPRTAFQRYAERVGGTWLPWLLVVLVVVGAIAAAQVYRRRERADRPAAAGSTIRPGQLEPALAGALVRGAPHASALPAVVLDLAGRGALTVEPERKGDKVRLRLHDGTRAHTAVERVVWRRLQDKADGDVVSSKRLAELAGQTKAVRAAVTQQLKAYGWWAPRAARDRSLLVACAAYAFVLLVVGLVFLAASGNLLLLVGTVGAGVLFCGAVLLAFSYPRLSREGQSVAVQWCAYRDGLGRAAYDDGVLDLDAALPDIVAMGLDSRLGKRLDAAGLAVLGSGSAAALPYTSFSGAFSTSTGSGGVVSGGGSGGGGGGGAAGST